MLEQLLEYSSIASRSPAAVSKLEDLINEATDIILCMVSSVDGCQCENVSLELLPRLGEALEDLNRLEPVCSLLRVSDKLHMKRISLLQRLDSISSELFTQYGSLKEGSCFLEELQRLSPLSEATKHLYIKYQNWFQVCFDEEAERVKEMFPQSLVEGRKMEKALCIAKRWLKDHIQVEDKLKEVREHFHGQVEDIQKRINELMGTHLESAEVHYQRICQMEETVIVKSAFLGLGAVQEACIRP